MKNTSVTFEVALELQKYIKEVYIDHVNEHAGRMHLTFEKGEEFIYIYRLYTECKEDFMKFSSKIRISNKEAHKRHPERF